MPLQEMVLPGYGLVEIGSTIQAAQCDLDCWLELLGRSVQGVLGEMGVAVLPAYSTAVLPDGFRESALVVTGHKIHFRRSSVLQAQEECMLTTLMAGEQLR